ncbi:MAG: hypothetical protein ACI9OJ_001602 [Myxococcota bacterium]|jgi:hypothetical protein
MLTVLHALRSACLPKLRGKTPGLDWAIGARIAGCSGRCHTRLHTLALRAFLSWRAENTSARVGQFCVERKSIDGGARWRIEVEVTIDIVNQATKRAIRIRSTQPRWTVRIGDSIRVIVYSIAGLFGPLARKSEQIGRDIHGLRNRTALRR